MKGPYKPKLKKKRGTAMQKHQAPKATRLSELDERWGGVRWAVCEPWPFYWEQPAFLWATNAS